MLTLQEELTSYKSELDNFHSAMQGQAEELEANRKEAAEFQIRLLRAQQDRNDAQVFFLFLPLLIHHYFS